MADNRSAVSKVHQFFFDVEKCPGVRGKGGRRRNIAVKRAVSAADPLTADTDYHRDNHSNGGQIIIPQRQKKAGEKIYEKNDCGDNTTEFDRVTL